MVGCASQHGVREDLGLSAQVVKDPSFQCLVSDPRRLIVNFGAGYLRLEYLSLRWGFGKPQWRGGETTEPGAWMELIVHASSCPFFSCYWSAEQNSVFLSVKLRPLYDPFVS